MLDLWKESRQDSLLVLLRPRLLTANCESRQLHLRPEINNPLAWLLNLLCLFLFCSFFLFGFFIDSRYDYYYYYIINFSRVLVRLFGCSCFFFLVSVSLSLSLSFLLSFRLVFFVAWYRYRNRYRYAPVYLIFSLQLTLLDIVK